VNANILSVLEAQRRANNARAGMIRLRNQRLQNRIDLHLALGGDFQTPAAR
jgi:outer membrane protein TolC